MLAFRNETIEGCNLAERTHRGVELWSVKGLTYDQAERNKNSTRVPFLGPETILAMRRSGSADLPLHSGHVPKWLAERMTRLGAVISQTIVHHYGRDELLRRLAHPFWFQSFG